MKALHTRIPDDVYQRLREIKDMLGYPSESELYRNIIREWLIMMEKNDE